MKINLLLIIVVLLCLNLVGCTKITSGSISHTDNFSSKSPTEESIDNGIGIPSNAIETETNGLYRFDNGIDEFSQLIEAFVSGDVLRLEYISPGLDTSSMRIITYSLSSHTILGEVSLAEDFWVTGEMNFGGFFTVSITSSEVVYYDKNCSETYRDTVFERGTIGYLAYVDADGKYMIYNRANDGMMMIYSFSSGISEELESVSRNSAVVGYKDGGFYLRDFDSGIIKISPEQKKAETLISGINMQFVSTDYEIYRQSDYFVITPLENNLHTMTPVHSEDENPLASGDNKFATISHDDMFDVIRIYDLSSSKVSPGIKVEGSVGKLLFCGNELLLIISADYESEKVMYYLYHLNETDGYENIVLTEADDEELNDESIPEWTGSTETIILAQALLDTYGIRVLYGENDIVLDFFTSNGVSEEESVRTKIQALLGFLDYFPEGMLDEIGDGNEIWLYMCVKPTYTSTGGNVDGIAAQIGKHPLIIMDTQCSDTLFLETIVHEVSHLIDIKASSSFITGWNDLLPVSISGEAYSNSYTEDYDNAYTPYDNGSTEVWFYDQYSRTFPTEDRAVIFQKMYISHVEGKMTEIFAENENLRMKARYYCVMLRKTFASCANAEVLPWETFFGEIDPAEFGID